MELIDDTTGQKYADYSPSSTGWYTDYTPEQRYSAYVATYMGVADLMLDGREQEIEAESMALLAWAPYDDDAYEAGAGIMASGTNPGLAELHKQVYGGGNLGGAYAELNLPKISRQNTSEYNVKMIKALSGNVPTMQTGAFYSPGVFEKVSTWLGDQLGGSVQAVQEAMGQERTEGGVDAEDLGPAAEESLGDTFYTASQYGHRPSNSVNMDMRIAAGNIGQFAAEGYMAAAGLGMAMRGFSSFASKVPATGPNAAARGAVESVGQGRSITQSIVQNMNKIKSSPYAAKAWQATRGIRYGSAAAAGATAVGGYAYARFADLSIDSMLSNLDEDTANTIREAAGYAPAPYTTEGNPGRDTTSAVGRMGARTQSFLQPPEDPVARAWQDSQGRP